MTMPTAAPRRHYIPVRKRELIAALRAEGRFDAAEDAAFADVCRVFVALQHHEKLTELEQLKDLYFPLDPDTPTGRADESADAAKAFAAAFEESLKDANFDEQPMGSVTSRARAAIADVDIKLKDAGIRTIRFFSRGARPAKIEIRRFFGLAKREVEADMLDDVIVLVQFKAMAELTAKESKAIAAEPGLRAGATVLKHFRHVARDDLPTLHPGAEPTMKRSDQLVLGVPAVAGGVPLLLQLGPALGVIFAVIAAYLGFEGVVDDSRLKQALAALSGIVALGAFLMRQRLKYTAQKLKYQKQLADRVYFRNAANNSGVLDGLVFAAEDQDAKEAILAYWALRTAPGGLDKPALDAACETFLRERFGLDVDFEIGDALAKLEGLGLVSRAGETLVAPPAATARQRLDEAWDAAFKFTGA
jgi:hypothetical protein